MRFPSLVVLILTILMSSCVTTKNTNNEVNISQDIRWKLLEPVSFGQSLSLSQLAEFTVNGEVHELLFQTEITNESITIVGLVPSGTRLFSLVFDGKNIQSEGYSQLIEKINPSYLLADMQFSVWPLAEIEKNVMKHSPCFVRKECRIIETNGGLKRQLFRLDGAVIEVNYGSTNKLDGEINFFHRERSYQIKLTTLSKEKLQK